MDLEEEEEIMRLERTTTTDESQLSFVSMLKDFPSLLNKSQLPAVKEAKEKSLQVFIKKWMGLTGETFTKQSLMKKINNTKARLKVKTDASQTGNKKIVLQKWEQMFLDLLKADDNPTFAKIPGAISSAGASVKPQSQDEHLKIAIISPPSVKRKVISQTITSIPPPPIESKKKRKADDIMKENETDETVELSNQQLQRLVMLEQLKTLRLKRQKLEGRTPEGQNSGTQFFQVLQESNILYIPSPNENANSREELD